MKYNDFPILNNNEYNCLNSHYLSIKTFNRKDYVYKIYKELNQLVNSNFSQETKLNQQINLCISNTQSELVKLKNNLIELFNFSANSTSEVTNMNIFSYMRRISLTASLFAEWSQNEEKEYYKSVAQKSEIELLDLIEKFLIVLEKINIKIYKYM